MINLVNVVYFLVGRAKLLGLTNHAETQQKKSQLEADLVTSQRDLDVLRAEIQQARQEQEGATITRDEHRNAVRKLKQMLSHPEALKNNLLREERRRDELSRKLERDAGQEKTKLVEVLGGKLTELMEGVSEIHGRCDTAMEATLWKEYTSRASRGVQAELFAAKEALEEANQRLSELQRLVKSLERERNVVQEEKLEAERVISDLEDTLGSEHELNEFFVRASREITENNRESLVQKREQLQGQLEATIDNPQLVDQYEKTTNDCREAREDHEERKKRLDELQESMAGREAAWVDNVRNVTAKLNKDFTRFMKELRFDGEVGLMETGGFLDYSVEMKVNFRSDGQSGLQPLSGQSHSGGERSVSTVM